MIKLAIGELTVHGVDVVRPERLGAEFETALTGLFRDGGVPAHFGQLEAPVTIVVDGPIRAEVLAERLARAVYRGLVE